MHSSFMCHFSGRQAQARSEADADIDPCKRMHLAEKRRTSPSVDSPPAMDYPLPSQAATSFRFNCHIQRLRCCRPDMTSRPGPPPEQPRQGSSELTTFNLLGRRMNGSMHRDMLSFAARPMDPLDGLTATALVDDLRQANVGRAGDFSTSVEFPLPGKCCWITTGWTPRCAIGPIL